MRKVSELILPQFATLLVPTIDSVRNEYIVSLSDSVARPVLLIGGSGTAKTSAMLQYLSRADPATMLCKKISFSSATRSRHALLLGSRHLLMNGHISSSVLG